MSKYMGKVMYEGSKMKEITTFSPTGILGYGFPEESLKNAQGFDIDVIACDGGSTDQGPNYLGQGKFLADREMVKRDLRLLLKARDEEDIPLLISTSGGSGSKEHLDKTVNIAKDIAKEEGLKFTLSKIYTDVKKSLLKEKLKKDEIRKLDYDKELSERDIDQAKRVVCQMGAEPYIEAIERGADVVLGGRSVDPAPFAAIPLKEGFDKGLTFHLGVLLECGAIAAKPGSGADSLIGILRKDHFEVVPPNPKRICTVETIADHTLYEKADPYLIQMPNGEVNVSNSEFEQVGEGTVRIKGTTFKEKPYSLLIEGVEKVGYRTIAPAGIRDPILISKIESVLQGVKEEVRDIADEGKYNLIFRKYGIDAVLKIKEEHRCNEIGIIIDVTGETQEIADSICSMARSTLLHYGFEGRMTTAGNLAFPFSPSDISVGEVYSFSIHHLLVNVDPMEIARIEMEEV